MCFNLVHFRFLALDTFEFPSSQPTIILFCPLPSSSHSNILLNCVQLYFPYFGVKERGFTFFLFFYPFRFQSLDPMTDSHERQLLPQVCAPENCYRVIQKDALHDPRATHSPCITGNLFYDLPN